MSDNGAANGHDSDYPVTFGARPNMVLTIEAASKMLTDWKREHPEQFGDYLLRTYDIDATVKAKRR
jgi:hypothetical protein